MENINDQEPTPEDDSTPDEDGDHTSTPDAELDVEPEALDIQDNTADEAAKSSESGDEATDDVTEVAADGSFTVDSTGNVSTDDTIEIDPPAAEAAFAGSAASATSAPPPLAGPSVHQNRLTRDPFATFGGVLSGIAHRYGWEVSLTRLAFVLALVATGGTAIIVYLLAWLIIPRATYWPPPMASRGNGVSGRDLGIGLVGLGALIVLGISSGEAAAVLVPLALVGGGIWLLVQNPRTQLAAGTSAGAPVSDGAYTMQATMPVSPPIAQPVAQQVAPKRSRLRRFSLIGLLGLAGLFLVSLIAIPILLFAAVFDGDFDVNFNTDPIIVTPDEIVEIPRVITEDAGEIIVDLRDVDFSSIEPGDTPVMLDVSVDAGRIEVNVPEDVRVSVDAESDLVGEVNLFGTRDDGISPELSVSVDDPQLVLELDVNAGEIVVTRGDIRSSITVEVD